MIGDFTPGKTVRFKWNTADPTGAPVTASSVTIKVYKDGSSTTEVTTGVTHTEDFDSIVGLNDVAIDTSADGTFYSAGSDFSIIATAVTANGISMPGLVLDSFSLSNRSALRPTTADRTLVVDASGLADANMVKAGPTGSGTAQTAGDIIGDTNDIQTRLPAALVSGRIDASVGAMAANVLTATAINADAITAAKVADGTIDAATFAAGAINAAAIAADAITDAKVAADVTIASVTGAVGSVTGAVGSVTGNVGGNVTGSVGSVVGAVGSVTGNVGGNVTGSVGSVATGGISAASFAAGAIDAAAIATDAIGSAELAASAITEIQSGLSTLDAAGVRTAVGLASANLDTQLSGIQADTDNLQTRIPAALVSGRIDASVGAMAADVVTASAIAADAIGASELAASAVTEIQSGLSTLDASAIRSAIGLASANLDSQLDALPTAAENASAVGAQVISDHGAGSYIRNTEPLDASGVRSAVGLASANLDTQLSAIDDYIDTEVAAIKAKTDNLPASPAASGDAMALTSGERATLAAAFLDLADAIETGVSLRAATRVMLAGLAGKLSGADTNAPVFRNVGDTKDRITATTDGFGNRTAVAVDGS